MPITIDELKKLKAKKKHKYNAVRTTRGERKFSSKLEARYFDKLKIQQQSGEILYFLCQIPLFLPGNVKYVCDFQVHNLNGSIEYVDTKGHDTPLSIAKRKIVEALYPIKIIIIKKI